MELPGITSPGGMMEVAESSAQQTRLQRLADDASNGGSREGLVKAAQAFEGVFLNTLMKAMRKTVPDNKLFNSNGPTKFYQQMYDEEMAKAMAAGSSGMGVADMIIRQFEATVEQKDLAATQPNLSSGPAIQPGHPLVGPPSPQAMERYQAMSSVGEAIASRQKLRFFAGRQETAVADTLQKFENDIDLAASSSGLEPSLILAVVMEESGGDPQARSEKGAMGLMQLMPATAEELGVVNPENPGENLLGGATYLAKMLDKFGGDLDLALAAYNAGPGNVAKAGPGVPAFPETRRYIEAVKTRYQGLGGGTDLANEKP